MFGVVAETVAARARSTVMVVKTGASHDVALFDALRETEGSLPAADALVESGHPTASTVDRWFAENTFHAKEFQDLRKLVDLKERQGLTISVGLPALNEEATIGRVIARLKGPLMDRLPLIDQLVVIDSSSTDRTAEIAREHGVPVFEHRTILPEMGSFIGKGEALWKSLHVLDGDIVAWIDTDIRNIQPRFVYGLLGPLLAQPRIQYVKGFYQRPIRESGTLLAEGGGRVTELMARPLINLFVPELSGLVQPLAGEYAGRRALLESVSFFTGYAVEMGLLIDTLDAVGLSAHRSGRSRASDSSQPAAAQPVGHGVRDPPCDDPQDPGPAAVGRIPRDRSRHEHRSPYDGLARPGKPRDRRRAATAHPDHPGLSGTPDEAPEGLRTAGPVTRCVSG